MGKGGGCVPSTSKKAVPFVASPPVSPKGRKTQTTEEEIAEHGPPHEAVVDTVVSRPESDGVVSASCSPLPLLHKIKVYIVFYSMYGHIELLAKHMKEGVDSVEGAEGCLFRVPETLSEEILQKMHAPVKDASIPIISPSELPAADAVLFGFPTRYGAMAAQMKAFFDSTGQLWKGQELAGKPAGFFVSTGTQGGGQETTAWTAITQLVHHGMLFVPMGYTFGADMFKLDEIRGGSPYGAGTFAGDGTRLPTQTELQFAKHQGQYIAGIAKRLVKGL